MKTTIRDEILKRVREEPLQYRKKAIAVLKQIPWKIRDLRKQYQFLTTKLNEKGINFRWLVPGGILINWSSRRYRLDSTFKAADFYERHGRIFKGKTQGEQADKEFKKHEIVIEETVTQSKEEDKEKENRDQEEEEPIKEQRQKRITRKLNPKYNY